MRKKIELFLSLSTGNLTAVGKLEEPEEQEEILKTSGLARIGSLRELNRAQVSSENVTSKYFQMLSCRQKQQLYSRWLVTVSFKTRKLQFLAADQNQ